MSRPNQSTIENKKPMVIPSAPLAANPLLPAALSIKEGNELIARFMGGVKQIIPKGGLHGYKEGTELWMCVFSSNPDPLSYLSFDSEWDWLMPVVDKIIEIDITPAPKRTGYRIEIVPRGYVKISGFPMPTITTNVSIEGSLIKAVWLAVVKFIIWHNQQGVSKR